MTEFDKYIRQGEPDQKEKAAAWQGTATYRGRHFH